MGKQSRDWYRENGFHLGLSTAYECPVNPKNVILHETEIKEF
jgi:hypothetical protein